MVPVCYIVLSSLQVLIYMSLAHDLGGGQKDDPWSYLLFVLPAKHSGT